MELFISSSAYARDEGARTTWNKLKPAFGDSEGVAYYRHPVFAVVNPDAPDLAIVARGFEPLAVTVVPYEASQVSFMTEPQWRVSGKNIDSPVLQLGDHVEGLRRRLAVDRALRTAYSPYGILALALMSRFEVERHVEVVSQCRELGIQIMAADDQSEGLVRKKKGKIDDRTWALTLSVVQNVSPLNKPHPILDDTSNRVGTAVSRLEMDIAILDNEQHKVSVEMAPGPQRIRGLAGTGKTVVLALKAANLHLQYPEANILVTYSTHSLFNQVSDLITRFYRPYADADPNWKKLHVQNGWGSAARPGVYSTICSENNVTPLTLDSARVQNRNEPLRACCDHALTLHIESLYDYILVDEAQDFPFAFFLVLYERARKERCIYFAYDELQNLSSIETPSTVEMFGCDDDGVPRVDLAGEYEGGIEKDIVLHKSYRCPRQNLVLAHGIGLGIKDEKNIWQMIDNRASWESFGYEIVKGNLRVGEDTIINRPPENSPNRIAEIYTGSRPIVNVRVARDRKDELEKVAEEIAAFIQVEGVKPEHIIVTSMKSTVRDTFMNLQRRLFDHGINSSIPGLVSAAWAFGVKGMVTLSTLRRAKGNEAPIVFIVGFESLYDYVDQIENRNKAFTAISRSKGWLRISGVGANMERAKREVEAILADDGRLCFEFPNMRDVRIRRLDASDTTRRRKELANAKRSAEQLAAANLEALASLDPSVLEALRRRLDEAAGDHR